MGTFFIVIRETHLDILDSSPKPLHIHLIYGPTFAVHA